MTPTPIDTLDILRSAALEEGARLPADRVAQQTAYIEALEAEIARLAFRLNCETAQGTYECRPDSPCAACAACAARAVRDAVTVVIHACTDVTRLGRFAPAVDPVRWVEELESHLRDAVKE